MSGQHAETTPPPFPASNGDEAAQGSGLSRARQAFFATKRAELQSPVHAIVDISERLLADVSDRGPQEFSNDLKLIGRSGRKLKSLIDEILAPDQLASASFDDFAGLHSRMRHDMLNALNPVINYSEMWLEEAEEHFLDEFSPDLKLLLDAGRRCHGLIDKILASGDMDSIELSESEMWAVGEIAGLADDDDLPTSRIVGRILIVDDNDTNRDILRRRLELQGHELAEACDGLQALAMLKAQPFDLVLLDIVMPHLNGVDVLTRMKASETLRDVPVIMISALDEIDVVVRCIKLGAEDYLSKPFNPIFLKARIGACLEKRQMAEQLRREKQRSDELLHVILPNEIVNELKATNAVIPRRYDGVAVLFADIVNFTPYCEKNPPEEVVQRLQELVVSWEDAALTHSVEKIKTIGDAFMAASGLLTRNGNPVLNCVRCGLEMIASTRRLQPEWNLRVGIHVGQVVAGILGHRQYLFDLWGDTVNTAARMESHGVAGGVTMSAQAWSTVERLCRGTPLGCVPVKGKGNLEMIRFDGFKG